MTLGGVQGEKEEQATSRSIVDRRAILINTSALYHNYRHTSNVVLLEKLLRSEGYGKKAIRVFSKENILRDKRNELGRSQGALCIGSQVLYEGQDFTLDSALEDEDKTYWKVLSLLEGEDEVMEGAGRDTNLLIYLTGHGGDGFIKYCNMKYFYRSDITHALVKLQEVRPLNHVLLIVDTCQAETLVDYSLLPKNVTVVATSLKGETSTSDEFNEKFGVFPIDLFIKEFFLLYAHGTLSRYRDATLKDLFGSELDKDKIKSTVTLHRGDAAKVAEFILWPSPLSVTGKELALPEDSGDMASLYL